MAHKETDRLLQRMEKKISREYGKAYRNVKKKADNYFLKFSQRDAEKKAQVLRGEMTYTDYLAWREGQMLVGKRWNDLRDSLAEDLSNANVIASQLINKETVDIYALNYNFGTYEIENGYHIDTSFVLVDHPTVERLLSDNPGIIPQASVNIPKDLLWNRQKITSAITQGILQGESIPNIAKRLRSVTGMNQKAAIRNARTYTTAAENGGRVDSYKRAQGMGIVLDQEWMATLDGRTRISHRHLDGEVVPVGGVFSNGCRYPGDPDGAPEEIYNCRCTLVAKIRNYNYQDEPRFSRLSQGVSYEDWKRGKS